MPRSESGMPGNEARECGRAVESLPLLFIHVTYTDILGVSECSACNILPFKQISLCVWVCVKDREKESESFNHVYRERCCCLSGSGGDTAAPLCGSPPRSSWLTDEGRAGRGKNSCTYKRRRTKWLIWTTKETRKYSQISNYPIEDGKKVWEANSFNSHCRRDKKFHVEVGSVSCTWLWLTQ